MRGDWLAALRHNERGWADYDGGGYIRSSYATAATAMALELHRISEARAWRTQLAHTDQVEWAEARWKLQRLDALLALFTTDPAALAECRDTGCGGTLLEARVHLALRGTSQQPHDDPCDPFHPARALLRKRPEGPENVHNCYYYRLAVVDYHLASLRYAAALPAADDRYYQRPDMIPARIHIADPQSFNDRLRRFDLAWRRLDQHARWLDGLLQCDFRTKKAESRRQRRDAIVQAIR
jgi:hypothetical protein